MCPKTTEFYHYTTVAIRSDIWPFILQQYA